MSDRAILPYTAFRPLVKTPSLLVVCGLLGVSSPLVIASEEDKRDRLSGIIAVIRENEALLRSIEFVYESSYELVHPMPAPVDMQLKTIKNSEYKMRYVYQNGLIYFKFNGSRGFLDGSNSSSREVIYGYDGVKTRCIEGSLENEIDGVKHHTLAIYPYTLILARGNIRFPLSEYLSGSNSISKYPYTKDRHFRTSVEGEDEIEGLKCIKVRTQTWSGRMKPEQGDLIEMWLVVSRNFLPIHSRVYRMRFSDTTPVAVGYADHKEIAPGVWFPNTVTIHVYPDARRSAAVNMTKYVLRYVKLNPGYGIELFRNIASPNAVVSYQIKNGEIHGARVIARPRSTSRFFWLLAVSIIVCICAIVVNLWSRRREAASRSAGSSPQPGSSRLSP